MTSVAVPRVFVASSTVQNLAKHLQKLLPTVSVVDLEYGNGQTGFSDDARKRLEDVEIVLCDGDALSDCLTLAPNLKWAQSTWAGVDYLMKYLGYKKPAQDFLFTRTDAYGDIMGEYVIGQIIAREKFFSGMNKYQENKEYDKPRFSDIRPLSVLSIGILGFGSIAKRVAEMCKFMGMTVWAVTRTHNTTPSPSVDHFRTVEQLDEVLGSVDYLCNILPGTPASCDLLSGDTLKPCQKKGTVFINVGRGSIISDESLIRAIREGWLGGAILDVFNQEPLPAHSPLWTLPGVTITPHISGVCIPELVAKSFANNVKLYMSGQTLTHVVDWEKGY